MKSEGAGEISGLDCSKLYEGQGESNLALREVADALMVMRNCI